MTPERDLFDTAWSGIYWCGSDECAVKIMNAHSDEMGRNDPIYFDLVCPECREQTDFGCICGDDE